MEPQLDLRAAGVRAAVPRHAGQTGSIPLWAKAVFFFAARATFGGFLVVTSAYCLLTYVPFTYFGFIQHPLMAWLPEFGRIHGYLFLALLVAVTVTIVPALRVQGTRRLAVAFVVINLVVGVALTWRSALATMGNSFAAYLWSMLALFPLLWIAVLDLALSQKTSSSYVRWRPSLPTAIFAGLAMAVLFAAASTLHQPIPGVPGLSAVGFGVSLAFHVVILASFGAVIELIGMLARRASKPERAEFVLRGAFSWLICTLLLRNIVLPTISFEGWQATVFAATVSLMLVIYRAGFMVRCRSEATHPGETAGLRPARGSDLWLKSTAVVALATAAYAIPVLIGGTDWDFVLKKVAVETLWGVGLASCRWWSDWLKRRAARIAMAATLVVAIMGFAGYEALAYSHGSGSGNREKVWSSLSSALDSYAGSDISFRTTYDILSRALDNEGHQDLYRFLYRNTNLGRDVTVAAPDLKLVSDLEATPGPKPTASYGVACVVAASSPTTTWLSNGETRRVVPNDTTSWRLLGQQLICPFLGLR